MTSLRSLAICLGVCWLGVVLVRDARSDDRPNVLFIAVDDLNDWVGCLGGHPQARTPHFDAVARHGVCFTNAHCAAPLCNPSRSAVFSGRQPFHTGIYTNDGNIRQTHPELMYLPQAFQRAGYRTYGTGKLLHRGSKGLWDKEFFPEQRWSPFTKEQVKYTADELPSKGTSHPRHAIRLDPDSPEIILPLNRMPSDRKPNDAGGESFDWGPVDVRDDQMGDGQITEWAIQRLGEHRAQHHDTPFFLGVGFYRPHIPLFVPRPYFDPYPEGSIILPKVMANDLDDLSKTGRHWALEAVTAGSHATVIEHGQWKAAVRAYLACVSFVDAQIGRLLHVLEQSGDVDNTIIVIWGDHGWHLGEKQHWGKWTGWERATKVPLIVAAGTHVSSKPFARNRKCAEPVSLLDLYPTLLELCHVPQVSGLDGQSFVPLLRDPSHETGRTILTTFDKGNYSIRDVRYRYIRYADGSEELYDHNSDPNEWTNLAHNPEYAAIKASLKTALP